MDETIPSESFDDTDSIETDFSLDSILEGRKNVESYSFFFDRFIPILEKKKIFLNRMKKAETDADLSSISSEAFGLLLLENHWDRWLDIYKKCGGGIGLRGSKKPKGIISTVQPKYTRGGLKNGKYREIGVGKGWSMEGIFHFNKLVQF